MVPFCRRMIVVLLLLLNTVLARGPHLRPVEAEGALRPVTERSHAKNAVKQLGNSRFSCLDVSLMLRKKTDLTHTITSRMNDIIVEDWQPPSEQSQKGIDKGTKYKIEALRLYQMELNASETSVYAALSALNRTLSSDYQSLDNVKKSCEIRLSETQKIALEAEENHNTLIRLITDFKDFLTTSNLSNHHHLMNGILSDISQAADRLEKRLKDDLFNELVQKKKQEGAEIETVVRVGGNRHGNPDDKMVFEQGDTMLVDSLSNHYTMSRPRDITVLVDDPNLVRDIVIVLVLGSMFGVICCLIGIPPLFGYCLAGILIGPAGYNVIKCVVQIETIGEFGAVFLVLMVGLEFSLEKLKKVLRFSLYSSGIILVTTLIMTAILGVIFGIGPKQCFIIATTISLSSSTLMYQFLEGVEGSGFRKRLHSIQDLEGLRSFNKLSEDTGLIGSLQGVLVIQDIQMASLAAFMPFFTNNSNGSSFYTHLLSIFRFLQLIFGFILMLLLTRILSLRILEPGFRLLSSVKNRGETLLLGTLSLCALLLAVSIAVGTSLEFGCFLVGVAISAQGSIITEQVKQSMESVKEIFSIFFFASIGFHVFPTFLVPEFFTIFTVTAGVIVMKLMVTMAMMSYHVGCCSGNGWLASVAMATVSEFSFILSSKARRLRLLTREMYLVLLSVTTLSLIVSPLLWRLPHLISVITRSPVASRVLLKISVFREYIKK